MTAGQVAVAILAALAALPVAFYAGWSLAEWAKARRGPDAFEQRARQALIAALTDPKPGRWS
jgi:hypothetical protein